MKKEKIKKYKSILAVVVKMDYPFIRLNHVYESLRKEEKIKKPKKKKN